VVLLEAATSGPIRGFAVTLLIGLLVSLFTALYVSKIVFDFILNRLTSEKDIKNWLAGGMNAGEIPYKINFLGIGRVAASLLVVLGLVTIAGASSKGLNWGVEFSGGTEAIVKFSKDVESRQLTSAAEAAGIEDMTTQALEGGKQLYILRYQDTVKDVTPGSSGEVSISNQASSSSSFLDLKKNVETQLADFGPVFEQVDYIGPQVGSELRSQGIMSLLYAVIGIMLYLALRFDLRFGPSLLIKMVVDCAIVLGFYFYFGMSFDLTSVAGFLTIAGYSVNDAIVIFDRIRENVALNAKKTFFEIVNLSLNETLGRSINTSIVTLISLTGIVIFCKGSIWNFAMSMGLGVISATLTSTFVAPWAIVLMEKFRQSRSSAVQVPKTT
jgi:SecD/SecF fusion protein